MVWLHGSLVTIFSFFISCSLALSSSEDTIRDAAIQLNNSATEILLVLASDLSSKCREDLTALKNGFFDREVWAVQMIDAASKFQSGLLQGNIRDLGIYDECVQVRPEQNSAHIQGQYCMFSISSPIFSDMFTNQLWKVNLTGYADMAGEKNAQLIATLKQDPTSAICVPSTCDTDDVVEIMNTIFAQIPMINEFGVNASAAACSKVLPDDVSVAEILTIALLGTVGTFMILSTLCDVLLRNEVIGSSKSLKLISQFSILKSTAAVFNTKILPGTMPAIHGIRFLSICWVIMAHRYLVQLARPAMNLREVLEWLSSWESFLIMSAPFAVDTCFVISGFLMTYLFLIALRSGRKINLPMLYVHRYIRLTPAVAIMILLTAYLLPRMGSGPLWDTVIGLMSDGCQNDWWRYLLYIQNSGHTKLCMLHTWYLATDMQLFWITPLILYPLHRWPKWGLVLLSSFTVASIVTPATLLGLNRFSNAPLIPIQSIERNIDQFEDWFIPVYCRATPYFVGIFLGFIVASKTKKLSKMQVRINWLATCCLLLACSVNLHLFYSKTYVYNIYREIITTVLARLCWSIGISWIIYASTQGYGGPVTRFLSLPLFLPLSRLSYCAYLTSFQFQIANSVAARTAIYSTSYTAFVEFWCDLLITFALSIVLTVFVESPIIALEKIMRSNGSKPEKVAASPPPQTVDESQEQTAESQA